MFTLVNYFYSDCLMSWLVYPHVTLCCSLMAGFTQVLTFLKPFSLQVVGLNFSSATSPELLLKTFDHYCEYRRTPNGIVLAPVQLGKWMVLFCDEINLPDMDHYGKYFSNLLIIHEENTKVVNFL